jgi:branched-subunit amino acid aminotransferase/4-amino-4-deoxychorismate lyase
VWGHADTERLANLHCIKSLRNPRFWPEEMLLFADGAIMEGLSSNFFAVKDSTLYTAGDGVLLGTVRDLIIKECKARGVQVQLLPPSMHEIDQWDGCIISSTSRLALPVDQLIWNDESFRPRVFPFSREGLVRDIDSWVASAIECASEPLR